MDPDGLIVVPHGSFDQERVVMYGAKSLPLIGGPVVVLETMTKTF